MRIYSHDNQMSHHPKLFFSNGQMREAKEKPERLTELLKAPAALGLPVTEAHDVGLAPILAVHDAGYVEFLKTGYDEWMCVKEALDLGDEVQTSCYAAAPNAGVGILAKAAKYQADGSAPIGQDSWTSIYWSAQTALSAADYLLKNPQYTMPQICLTRPAGHHARKSAAGGFCYLNNAAIIAQYLRQNYEKIAIIDTDVHHGQGIQEIFYNRKDVLYTSVHGDPVNFYPIVAGHANEKGEGAGLGYNVNFPMPHGASETVFFDYVEQAIATLDSFNPDVIVHVLGFDVYKDDPLTRCSVSTEGFTKLAKRMKAINKPLIILVEGGYCIEMLNENLQAFIKGLTEA